MIAVTRNEFSVSRQLLAAGQIIVEAALAVVCLQARIRQKWMV